MTENLESGQENFPIGRRNLTLGIGITSSVQAEFQRTAVGVLSSASRLRRTSLRARSSWNGQLKEVPGDSGGLLLSSSETVACRDRAASGRVRCSDWF